MKKLCGQPTNKIEPTLGFQITTTEHSGYKLNLWDIGGQRSIRAYWRNYFEQTDGLIWVVDSTDISRLELCKEEMYQVLQQEKLMGATVLIFANKQDIIQKNKTTTKNTKTNSSSDNRVDDDSNKNGDDESEAHTKTNNCDEIADALELNDDNIRFEQRHWKIQGCSGITGEGLMDGIEWLVEDISNRIFFLS